jgi:putative membrane protein
MATLSGFVPYCGAPPVPGAISWNLDPILMGVLVVGAALYAWRSYADRAVTRRQHAAFYVGWVVLAASLISPLCNLGVALFSARIAQHMIVSLIAAPLLVIGGADELVLSLGTKHNGRTSAPKRWEQYGAVSVFAVVLWFWHLTGPYDSTLRNNVVYWAMELSLLASAMWLWRALIRLPTSELGHGLTACLFTTAQMCALGVLLTFSNHAWYDAHSATTWIWGLSPLQDQRLGGLIMWVPGGMLLAGYFTIMLAKQIGLSDTTVVALGSRTR